MTLFHWLVEQLMRLRGKKEGAVASTRVRAEAQSSEGGRDVVAEAEYERLEADRVARAQASQKN